MRRTEKELQKEIIEYKVYQDNDKWIGYRICPDCKRDIIHSSLEKCILLRNIRNLKKRNAPCSSCGKIGKRNPFYEKKHSEKTKLQVSKSRTGKACGEYNSMANPEHRKKVSIALKKKYESGELDFLKKIQSENAIKNQSNGKLKTAPISIPEKELKEIFENLGYQIESQFKIGSLRYDLFIKEKNILIEYNGDYWHCNPNLYEKNYLHKKKKLYAYEIWNNDLYKKELAEKKGHKLFIIWEKDYKFNKNEEINKILNYAKQEN